MRIKIIQNSRRVLAIEMLCAAQAADIRGVEKLAPVTRELHAEIRQITPVITNDRVFAIDICNLANWIKKGVETMETPVMF